jgi:hypothetical protein
VIQASTLHLVVALIGALALVTLALAVFLPQGTAAHCRSASKTEDQPVSPLATRVPISEIRDGLIVRRDGSFCAVWECSGVATQVASAERLGAANTALDVFIKSIRHPVLALLWITAPVAVAATLLVFALGALGILSIHYLVVHAPTQF